MPQDHDCVGPAVPPDLRCCSPAASCYRFGRAARARRAGRGRGDCPARGRRPRAGRLAGRRRRHPLDRPAPAHARPRAALCRLRRLARPGRGARVGRGARRDFPAWRSACRPATDARLSGPGRRRGDPARPPPLQLGLVAALEGGELPAADPTPTAAAPRPIRPSGRPVRPTHRGDERAAAAAAGLAPSLFEVVGLVEHPFIQAILRPRRAPRSAFGQGRADRRCRLRTRGRIRAWARTKAALDAVTLAQALTAADPATALGQWQDRRRRYGRALVGRARWLGAYLEQPATGRSGWPSRSKSWSRR